MFGDWSVVNLSLCPSMTWGTRIVLSFEVNVKPHDASQYVIYLIHELKPDFMADRPFQR